MDYCVSSCCNCYYLSKSFGETCVFRTRNINSFSLCFHNFLSLLIPFSFSISVSGFLSLCQTLSFYLPALRSLVPSSPFPAFPPCSFYLSPSLFLPLSFSYLSFPFFFLHSVLSICFSPSFLSCLPHPSSSPVCQPIEIILTLLAAVDGIC